MNSIEIIPSLLSMDFSCIERSLRDIPDNVNILHLDIMDGVFVNNITFGPFIAGFIRKNTDKILDAHLMISRPEQYVQRFADSGVNMISFHIEACEDPMKLIDELHDKGIKAGIAVNPETDIHSIDVYIENIDYVLIMSVHPGFAGQKFIPDVLEKIEILKEMQSRYNFSIEIDGGINGDTARIAIERGAQWIVTGSYLFSQSDMKQTIKDLLNGH